LITETNIGDKKMNAHKILKTALLVGFSLFVVATLSLTEFTQRIIPLQFADNITRWNSRPGSLHAIGVAAPLCHPKIDIRKQEEGPDTRYFSSGDDVTYEIVVTNTGDVDLSNVVVTDSKVPSCNHQIGNLAEEEEYTYICEMPDVKQGFENIAMVQGEASNGEIVTDEDPSTVEIPSYNITIGYEDLELVIESDFDYNDWVISILTDLQGVYIDEDTIVLSEITFDITPEARGAFVGHDFHMRFDSNVFKSDGVVELDIKDRFGKSVKEPEIWDFFSSKTFDEPINFDITGEHTCTCEAFGDHVGDEHKYRNTDESSAYNGPARRTAVLSIKFYTPFEFDIPDLPKVEQQHCQGLFFDPYLHVVVKEDDEKTHYDITRTAYIDAENPERRIICVADPDWAWPEEHYRIDRVYTKIQYLGPPTFFEFPVGWYKIHNDNVFNSMQYLYIPAVLNSMP
jgi:hypothetical protein